MILSRRAFALCTAGTALGIAGSGLVWPRQGHAQTWDAQISDFDQVMGSPDAPVTLVEYASFTCGFCASFHGETLPEIKSRYVDSGQVRFIFRDFPLDGLSLRAGMLARCVEGVDYFAVVDELFANQRQWARADDPIASLQRLGQLAGLSEEAFLACMNNETLANQIIQLRLDAEERYNVNSTPTFVMNGEVFAGALPIDAFIERIEMQLGS